MRKKPRKKKRSVALNLGESGQGNDALLQANASYRFYVCRCVFCEPLCMYGWHAGLVTIHQAEKFDSPNACAWVEPSIIHGAEGPAWGRPFFTLALLIIHATALTRQQQADLWGVGSFSQTWAWFWGPPGHRPCTWTCNNRKKKPQKRWEHDGIV